MAEPVDTPAPRLKANYFERRHPLYAEMKPHWDFLEQTYKGGRAWFTEAIFKYFREGSEEFNDRLKRSYRFNHTREVVDLVTKYIFKGAITRTTDAPEEIQKFWRSATRKGAGIDVLMREVSRNQSIFGQPYIVVDSSLKSMTGRPISRAEERDMGARVYAYVIKPQHVLDASFDAYGKLNWILIWEDAREDENFFTNPETFQQYDTYRLWTREEWYLYRRPKPSKTGSHSKTREEEMELVDYGVHGLGTVPVIPAPERESDDDYAVPGMIDDVAYLDRAVANYLSNLDAIIQDQTFSQLVIPAQNLLEGDDAYQKILELGTKRILVYDAEHGGEGPKYISADPSQPEIILSVITKLVTEIYHSIGMAGERTKMDNAAGIDNSSGVAKAYDFDRMNTALKSKADRLKSVEVQIEHLVMAWYGKELEEDHDGFVSYPEEFDTRGLYDEFDVANRLSMLSAPDEIRRFQMERLIEKMFPQLPEDVKSALMKELKDWPPDPVEQMQSAPFPGSRAKPTPDNKQGQNNKDEKQQDAE